MIDDGEYARALAKCKITMGHHGWGLAITRCRTQRLAIETELSLALISATCAASNDEFEHVHTQLSATNLEFEAIPYFMATWNTRNPNPFPVTVGNLSVFGTRLLPWSSCTGRTAPARSTHSHHHHHMGVCLRQRWHQVEWHRITQVGVNR